VSPSAHARSVDVPAATHSTCCSRRQRLPESQQLADEVLQLRRARCGVGPVANSRPLSQRLRSGRCE
jgi:hypothetical protein